MKKLETLMRKDAEYAQAWHDNLACGIVDGTKMPPASWAEADKAAALIMWRFFGVKTKGQKS